jgi:cytochrome P450
MSNDVLHHLQVPLKPYLCACVAQDLFGAAVETATTTLQWAMAELMANPSVLKKAQLEIRHFMAGQARVHEAAPSNNLGYLEAIIEETLRLLG